MQSMDVKGLAHITGGGLVENVPRVLQANLTARIERAAGRVRRCSTGCKEAVAG